MTKTTPQPAATEAPTSEPKASSVVVDTWFEGQVKHLVAHRVTADVFNDLFRAKETLKELL